VAIVRDNTAFALMSNGVSALAGGMALLQMLKLLTITKETGMARDFPPIHPGEILLEDFLKPMGLTGEDLARSLAVSLLEIEAVLGQARPITADLALRLGRFFEMEAQFWMNLQGRYELEMAREQLGQRLWSEVRVYSA
jgi:addiction module HigA family antidote